MISPITKISVEKNLVYGSCVSPKTQPSTHSTHEVVGTKHTFASSQALERMNSGKCSIPHRRQIWNVRSPEHTGYLVNVQE